MDRLLPQQELRIYRFGEFLLIQWELKTEKQSDCTSPWQE
jgi:hypothetical protein